MMFFELLKEFSFPDAWLADNKISISLSKITNTENFAIIDKEGDVPILVDIILGLIERGEYFCNGLYILIHKTHSNISTTSISND